MEAEKAIIIDGNSIIYRAYYANKPPKQNEEVSEEELKDQKATILNAIKSICYSFLKQKGNYKYYIMVFDSTKDTFRRQKFKDYKSNRESMPKVLYESLEDIRGAVEELGFNVLPAPVPYEADDVICTLSREFTKFRIKTDVFSTDNDLLQLVSYYTTVFIWKIGGVKLENNFKNFHELNNGLSPYQIPHLKAISGDSSDNYKGAKGIGEKIATKLLQQYGNIDKIYKNLENLSEKTRAVFEEYKRDVYDCLDLATTRDDANISLNPRDYVKKT